MDNGHVRSSACEDWQLGMDCTFDERSFYAITAGLWLLTSLPLAGKAFLPWGRAPTGAAKWCLLSTAASSACMSIDALLYVSTGPHGRNHKDGRIVIFMAIGTIFLGFGMRWFSWLWCTIAAALESQASSASDGSSTLHSARSRIGRRIVRVSYELVAFVNVPVALFFALGGTEIGLRFGLSFDNGVKVWFGWCLFSACLTFTLNAIVMLIVVQCFSNWGANAGSIALVTKINLAEQLFYDVCLSLAGLLYLQPAYNEYGAVQATVYALMVLPAWMMHAQVLIFFVVTTPDDPLYSEKRLHDLLLMNDAQDCEAVPAESLPDGWTAYVDETTGHTYYNDSTTGQSQWEMPTSASQTPAPRPKTIGSPELEHAQARPVEELGIEIPPPHIEAI